MPCYVLVINKMIGDDALKSGYGSMAQAAMRNAGGKYRAFSEAGLLLEGSEEFEHSGCGIVEFPDLEAAKAFWLVEEYGAAKKLRAGKCHAVVVAMNSEWMEGDTGFATMGTIAAKHEQQAAPDG